MAGVRGRRGRGELLHEMGFSLVGCIRNLTLNVEFEDGKGAETVISVQRKNAAEYDTSAFDDAEMSERVEPDGQRSDQTFRLVDEGGRGKKEVADEQSIKPVSTDRSHSIEIQFDHVPVVKETYYPAMQKHGPIDEKSEHMAYVAKEFPLVNPSAKDNQCSGRPDNGNKEKDFPLVMLNREEKELPWLPDYDLKEPQFNKPNESAIGSMHNETDFSQKIMSREFGSANQMSADFKSRSASSGCFTCGKEGHMSRDCPSKKAVECRICKQEGHMSRDCPAKKTNMQCHSCGLEGHISRDCTAKKTNMQCHSCGLEGHISRDCTAKKTNTQCHSCGLEGHISRDCTAKKTNTQCHSCGVEGHLSRDCTAKKTNTKCTNCGLEGHVSRDCTASRACRNCGLEGHISRDCTSSKTCRKCGQEGHIIHECSVGKTAFTCYNCGLEGHMSRDCPTKKTSSTECRKCGQEGHMAKDCPTSDGAKDDRDDRPPPYIPPPPPDDDAHIFETLLKGINFNKYDEIPIECTGHNAPASGMNSFFDSGLSDVLQNNIKKSQYDRPTPIQKWAIPVIMDGRDVMACAVTGSGKTAAFLLPILTKIIRNETMAGTEEVATPEALILSPTRELAVQIYHETRKFSHDTMVKSAVVYGGVSSIYLFQQFKHGVHVMVATPGRLLDLTKKGKISLSSVKHLVLDEADRMLDMGFLPDLRSIVNEHGMPGKTSRQTLMFSATFPDDMQLLAAEMLNDYIFITVGSVGGASQDIEQNVHKVPQSEKRQKLFDILQAENSRVVVFVELKRNADFLSNQLTQSKFPTASIHGDLSQKDREAGLSDFRNGRATVLVATSVAARGLDIPEVKHVINYDMPSTIEEYVHRIGRTGRCGNLGRATSFFDPERDSALARPLVKVLVDAKQAIPDWLEEMAVHAVGTGGFTGRSDGRFGARDNRRHFGKGRPRVGEGDAGSCEAVASMKQQQQQQSLQQQDDTWDD